MFNSNKLSFFKWVGILCVFIFCFTVQPASAKIYKWKDDTGKVFFTDDESKIPAKFRKGTHIKKVREVQPIRGSSAGGGSDKGASSGGSAGPAVGEEEAKPEGILSEKEKTVFKAAVALLKKEAAKDGEIGKIVLNTRNAKNVVVQLQAALPGKKKALADLETVKAPEAGQTASFLKTSIAADEALSVSMPRLKNQVAKTQARLKGEMTKANELIATLNAALKKSDEVEAKATADQDADGPPEKSAGKKGKK